MVEMLKRGSKGERVKALQAALMRGGFSVGDSGVDGVLGRATLEAVEAFFGTDPVDNTPDDTVSLDAEAEILAAKPVVQAEPTGVYKELVPGFIDVGRAYAGESYPKRNPWTSIDTICLHQMAVDGGSGWARWKRLAIHVVVPRKGVTALTNSPDRLVPHGHGFNSRSVGFEVEGHFAGVVGRASTHWTPEGAPASRRSGPRERRDRQGQRRSPCR